MFLFYKVLILWLKRLLNKYFLPRDAMLWPCVRLSAAGLSVISTSSTKTDEHITQTKRMTAYVL